MREVTITAKTVDMAVVQGLEQLGAKKEDVSVHIIDYGKRSFLGMFGGKPAIVRLSYNQKEENGVLKQIEEITVQIEETTVFEEKVTVEEHEEQPQTAEIIKSTVEFAKSKEQVKKNYEQVVEQVQAYLQAVLTAMGLDVTVTATLANKEAVLNVEGKDAALIIGRRGQTLNAIQYLCQLVSNRKHKHYLSISLDVENYREKRKETLTQLSSRIYDKVISTKKPYELEPMPAFERKIIHSYMAGKKGVITESVGEEPNRHLVILPKSK